MVSDANGTPKNIYDGTKNTGQQFEVGKKTIAVIANDDKTILASKVITVSPNSSLSSSKQVYDFNEPIEITASTEVSESWIGLITTGLNYTNWSYVTSEPAVYDLSKDQTVPPGNYTVALFAGNGFVVDKAIAVKVARTYNDPTWTHNDDYTEFTATFTATDDPTKTITRKVTGTDIAASVTKDPTCEDNGQTSYTASLDMSGVEGFKHKDGKTEFEDSRIVYTPKALGHDWGEWTEVTPATETDEGLERRVCTRDETHVEERAIPVTTHEHRLTHVAAKAAACLEPGNTEYWVCDQDVDGYVHCGKYFSDAEGTTEIAQADTVISATGHDYGNVWTPVEGTRTHKRVCANDSTHVETADCTFGEGVKHGNKVTYTCTVCGNSYDETPILFTDKEEYAFNDPIMVTATADDPNAWVGLYEKDAVPGSGPVSLYYHYVNGSHGDAPTSGSGQAFDVKQGTSQGSLSAGQYDVILFSDGGYNVAARVTITIAAPRDPELSIDRTAGEDGRIAYKLGEPVVVTAVSDQPGAWVGLYPYSDSDPLDRKYYKSFSVVGNDDGFDIMQGSDGPNADQLVPGRYKVILFNSGYDIATINGNLAIRSFYLDEAYNDPTFDWSDDHKTCTAVFTATHDDTVTKEIEATVSEQITAQPKCTEPGAATYTASVSVPATGDDAFATVSGQTEFSDVQENVEVAALGHDWGEWTTVTPATETAEGLERRVCTRDETHTEERAIPVTTHVHKLTHVEAKDATCEEDGNTEYWTCDQGDNPCGKYFSDADGTTEIESDSVIKPKLGHKYGDWVYDDATGTHSKVCANDSSHVVTENCSFGEEVLKDGAYTKTCTVCGGTHVGDVLLSTDKKVYTSGDPVMVTANYDDDNAWVGLYKKGEKVDPDNGGVKSIYWYYLSEAPNPNDLMKARDENERTLEDGTADYTVALLTKEGDNWYKLITSVDITIEVPAPPENPLHTDKDTYDLNEPIMVDAQCHNAGAWVGMYKKGEIPGDDMASIFWYYVAEEDNPANILATRDENGRGGDYAPGEFTIMLFGNGNYDKILATKDITITASAVEADPVTLKLNDEDVTAGASKEFLNGTKVTLQPGCEGNPGASWIGIYDKAVSAADNFGGIKAIDRINVSDYLDKPYELTGCADGTWSAVVFGGVGYNQVKTVVTMTFRKDHILHRGRSEALRLCGRDDRVREDRPARPRLGRLDLPRGRAQAHPRLQARRLPRRDRGLHLRRAQGGRGGDRLARRPGRVRVHGLRRHVPGDGARREEGPARLGQRPLRHRPRRGRRAQGQARRRALRLHRGRLRHQLRRRPERQLPRQPQGRPHHPRQHRVARQREDGQGLHRGEPQRWRHGVRAGRRAGH